MKKGLFSTLMLLAMGLVFTISATWAEEENWWKIQSAKVVAKESIQKGTLITVNLPLNDPFGPDDRAYLTGQSPFVINKKGDIIFWQGWMNTTPNSEEPHLWMPLNPGSVEIEVIALNKEEYKINTRAVKDTQIALLKPKSSRSIKLVNDTVQISLYFEIEVEDIKTIGTILYKRDSSETVRDKGLNPNHLRAWGGLPNVVSAQASKLDVTRDPSSNLVIKVLDSVQPQYVTARYSTFKNIPQDYQAWQMSAGSSFGEEVINFSLPTNKTLFETLVLFKNKGTKEEKVEMHNLSLEISGERIQPWEYLPGNVYGSYSYLKKKLSLTGKEPGSNIIKLSISGNIYVDLKPGEQAWVALIFLVPRNMKESKLIIGKAKPVTIKPPRTSKQ